MPTAESPRTPDARQATSSHMMKTTKRGRPFLKDTLDLFATLIVSLELTVHKQFFRTFPNSFNTDEAAHNLAQLKFSQSNRGADPRDPTRIVTTTTTTTFSMTRDMAKAMCQHFMDARLIENAADRSSNLFKDRGVYQLTPKGLHVLERFISKNGISADHLLRVFSSQPICLKLLHLERRGTDDEIIISQSVVTALFRRFVGRAPNYVMEGSGVQDANQEYHERSKGISLMHVSDRTTGVLGSKTQTTTWKDCFAAVTALEWLCDFTSIVGRDEAAEMSAHFVRFGLIALVSDKRKGNDSAIIFTVRGNTSSGNPTVAPQGEFRCTAKAIYRITEEGRRVARWDAARTGVNAGSPNTSSLNITSAQRSSVEDKDLDGVGKSVTITETSFGPGSGERLRETLQSTTDSKLQRRLSVADRLDGGAAPTPADVQTPRTAGAQSKESNTDRLRWILEEPSLRSLFREFLRGNFCEENLSFWLDVQDFKRKFSTTSSANAAIPQAPPPGANKKGAASNTPGQAAMEKHHDSLIQMAFVIYNTYLAPSSQCELNIDHGLRNELVGYLSEVMTDLTGQTFQGRVEPEHAAGFNATQLQTMIRLYERIQNHVFRLMATDSVPKFIKTPKFLSAKHNVVDSQTEDLDDFPGPHFTVQQRAVPSHPPGLDEEEDIERGRAYMTESQAAYERAQLQQQGLGSPSAPVQS